MAVVKRFALDGITYDIEPTNIDAVPTEGSNNTVSSSGVKSYVDSNYVPLSATQAPVTGLTDILTPVNLLPNSDFSRSNLPDYPIIATYESITNNEHVDINYFIRITAQQDLSNVTVTVSKNSINVKGTISSSDGQTQANGAVVVQLIKNCVSPGIHYSSGASCNPIQNISSVRTLPGGASILTIYNDLSNSYNRRIWYTTNSSSNTFMQISVLPTAGTNIEFEFTISDIYLYEGEFKNPPVTTSLDVKPGNQFAFTELDNVQISPVSYGSLTSGWWDLGVIRWNQGISYLRFLINSYGTSLYPQQYILEAAVSGYNTTLMSTYLTAKIISGPFASLNNKSLFTKFRLGRDRSDSAGYLCIQGYHDSSSLISKVSIVIDSKSTTNYKFFNGNSWITTIRPSTTDIVTGTSEVVPTIEYISHA